MIKNKINSIIKLKTSHEILILNDYSKIINIGGSSLNFYDVSTHELLADFKDLKNPSHICISNNNKEIGLINTAGRIAIYNISELKNIQLDKKNKPETCNIHFTPDDKFLVIGDWAGNIYIFDKITTKCSVIAQFNNSMITSIDNENDNYYFLITPKANQKSGKIEDYIKIIEWKYPFNTNKPKDKQFKINSSNKIKFKNDFLILNDQFNHGLLVINYKTNKILTKLKYEGSFKDFSLSNNLEFLCLITDDKINLFNFKDLSIVKEYNMKYACFVDFSKNNEYIILGSWNTGIIIKIDDFIKL